MTEERKRFRLFLSNAVVMYGENNQHYVYAAIGTASMLVVSACILNWLM